MCQLVILATRALELWMGWWLLASGLGLVGARFLWVTTELWTLPYLAFWVWIIVLSIRLLRRPGLVEAADS